MELENTTRWSLGLLLGLIVIAVAGIYLVQALQSVPSTQLTYWAIPLTAQKADVKLLKGAPGKTYLSDDKSEEIWEYRTGADEPVYRLKFRNDEVRWIVCSGTGRSGCPDIQNLHTGSDVSAITEKFGKPSNAVSSTDERRQTISYENYNVMFGLEENRASVLGIYNPKYGSPIGYISTEQPK